MPEYPRELLGYWDHYAVLEEIPDDDVVEIIRITEDGILEGTSDNVYEFRYSVTDLEDATESDSRRVSPKIPPGAFAARLDARAEAETHRPGTAHQTDSA